ncbi:MAG: LPS export ABC transporter periplasmic protein LptC, partial [Candidatus Brocadiia bacterium]
MDRAFRISLRVALFLTVLAGSLLIVYSVRNGGRGPRPVRRVDNAAAPEQSTAAAQQEGSVPAADAGQGSGEADKGRGMESVLLDFSQLIRDPEQPDSEALLTGPRAVYNSESKLWRIVEPLMVARLVAQQEGEPVDVRLEEVNIRANNALLNESKALVELVEDVRIRSEDLQVSADQMAYRAGERMLTSDERVQIRHQNGGEEAADSPTMTITGQGLQVQLDLRKMVIPSSVTVQIYGVSEEFLAGEAEGTGQDTGSGRVTITCDGRMTYDHPAQRVVFHQNVRASFGLKRLTCDKL